MSDVGEATALERRPIVPDGYAAATPASWRPSRAGSARWNPLPNLARRDATRRTETVRAAPSWLWRTRATARLHEVDLLDVEADECVAAETGDGQQQQSSIAQAGETSAHAQLYANAVASWRGCR